MGTEREREREEIREREVIKIPVSLCQPDYPPLSRILLTITQGDVQNQTSQPKQE